MEWENYMMTVENCPRKKRQSQHFPPTNTNDASVLQGGRRLEVRGHGAGQDPLVGLHRGVYRRDRWDHPRRSKPLRHEAAHWYNCLQGINRQETEGSRHSEAVVIEVSDG